jgi:RHS repeat-associated protein
VNGGNAILADNKVVFNDMLGSSLGVVESGKFCEIRRTSFGELMPDASCLLPEQDFFTGKPSVEGLGYAFLFRNYRAETGKWQSSDPLGYPDGWNNLAYVNNFVVGAIDRFGLELVYFVEATYLKELLGMTIEDIEETADDHDKWVDLPDEYEVRPISDENSVFDSWESLEKKVTKQVKPGDHVIIYAHGESGKIYIGNTGYLPTDPGFKKVLKAIKKAKAATVTMSVCCMTANGAKYIKDTSKAEKVYYSPSQDTRNGIWDTYRVYDPEWHETGWEYDPDKRTSVLAE